MSCDLSAAIRYWSAVNLSSMLGIILGVACVRQATRPSSDCLQYEPQVVVLRGDLREVFKYGPPNYGENPESDSKMWVPMLELTEPVSVCGDTSSEVNKDSISGIRDLQLIFPVLPPSYGRLLKHPVIVSGTLEQATFGPMFTPVVLTVRTLEADSKR